MTGTETFDARALRSLAEAHAAELTRHVSGMLGGDVDSARDIVQDAFVRLWRRPPQDASHPRAWLYSVCRSRAIDLLRRRRRWVWDDDDVLISGRADSAPSPAEKLDAADAAGALFALVDTLPPRQAEIVRLRFRDDLSYAEIAEVMGMTVTNVGVTLHTALKTLRARLAPTPGEPAP